MTLDQSPIIPPQATPKVAPKPAKKAKPSFFKLLGDFGSYLLQRKSAASLSEDINDLEAERARIKASELAESKEKEAALKKDRHAHLASEYKTVVAGHSDRIKHLEESLSKTTFTVPKPPYPNASKFETPFSKSSEIIHTPSVPKPPVISTPPAPKAMPSIKSTAVPEPVAKLTLDTSSKPSELKAKDKQELNLKKNKAAQSLSEELVKHTKQILKSKIENRAWNAFSLPQVNLIKEHRSMFFNWQSKMLSMIFFVVLTCLVCVLAYGYLLILEKEKQSSNLYIFTNLDNINKQIASVKRGLDESIVPFNDKLMYTGYMLDNHIYWTNFFQFLEQDTLADVYYSAGMDATISGNVKGSNGLFELSSVAKDYNTISNQTKVMAKSKTGRVLSVSVSDADSLARATSTPDQIGLLPRNIGEAVKFKLKLSLDQRLFLRDK